MHLSALFKSMLISLTFILLVLPQHNRPYLIWLIKRELKIKILHLNVFDIVYTFYLQKSYQLCRSFLKKI